MTHKLAWMLLTVLALTFSCDKSNKPNQTPRQIPGTGNVGKDATQTVVGAGALSTWCQNAEKTSPVQTHLQDIIGYFCVNGQPTKLLAEVLPGNAYAGNGEPTLNFVENFSDDTANNQTSATIGTGIKLPITSAAHFDKVAPLQGDKSQAEQLASAQGADATVTILENFTQVETNHVRGFKINTVLSKPVIASITINTKSTSRTDQYRFSDSLFQYSSYLTEDPKEGIFVTNMLTANVQLDSGSYLLTVTKVTVDNRGFASAAHSEISKAGTELVKAMYQVAATKSQ